jgi:hypothetical protein
VFVSGIGRRLEFRWGYETGEALLGRPLGFKDGVEPFSLPPALRDGLHTL